MSDPQTTARAVDRYADLVWRLALARCGNVPDAEDVFQEVFLQYLRRGQPFDSPEHEKAWLIRCTIHRSFSLLTAAHRRRDLPLDTAAQVGVEDGDRAVYAAVLALPQKYRTAIHLHYCEGLSLAEIAQVTGARPGTVKSWLSRGRAMLADALRDH